MEREREREDQTLEGGLRYLLAEGFGASGGGWAEEGELRDCLLGAKEAEEVEESSNWERRLPTEGMPLWCGAGAGPGEEGPWRGWASFPTECRILGLPTPRFRLRPTPPVFSCELSRLRLARGAKGMSCSSTSDVPPPYAEMISWAIDAFVGGTNGISTTSSPLSKGGTNGASRVSSNSSTGPPPVSPADGS